MGLVSRFVGGVTDIGKGALNLVESGYDAAKKGVNTLADAGGDMVFEVGDCIEDPAGYVQKELGKLSISHITHAVTLRLLITAEERSIS